MVVQLSSSLLSFYSRMYLCSILLRPRLYKKRPSLAVPYCRKLPCLFVSLRGVAFNRSITVSYRSNLLVRCRTTEARVESLGRLGHSMQSIGLVDRGSSTLPGGGGGGAPTKNGGTLS